MATHFSPRYDPWDQRFCAAPGGDFFAAIRSGAADVRTARIERFARHGLLLESGEELRADVVVTATGLEMLFLGGMALGVDGRPVDPASRLVYRGMMLEDVPNLAFAIGYTNASWTLKCDLTCDYVCRLLAHLRATGTTTCTPHNAVGATADGALLGLTSGYITRAADRLPKQGNRTPWRVHQSYLRDYGATKFGRVEDRCMEFSGSSPR